MTIEPQKVQELVVMLKRRYPNWTGFQDAEFAKDEITYKRDTITKAQKELSADELKRLLDGGAFDEFVSRLETIGHDNNLLYQAVPTTGDLGILYHPKLDKPAFCRVMFDLLHGPDAGHLRLTRYTDYVKAAGLPNKWAFPTFFLFVCHPESEMFIKPRTTRWFVEFAAGYKAFASTPTPFSYVTVKQLAEQLLTDLREFSPRDMVDIQSFIWVCAWVARQAPPVSVAGPADGGAMALAESGPQKKGARFARWMGSILDALRSLGGVAPAKAVLQRIQETTPVPDASFTEILASGQTRFYNEAHWARQELVWEGLVDCPERGKWTLTAIGKNTTLDEEAAQRIVTKWAARHRQEVEMGAEPLPFFTAKTFELLAGLHETPTKDFYAAHKPEFKEHLEEPFRRQSRRAGGKPGRDTAGGELRGVGSEN